MNQERILVIEDENEIRELIQLNLELNGFSEVLAVADGETGLKIAESQTPALILLDVMLPGMDGYSVCRQLKANQKTASIPVIMLTAKDKEMDVVNGLELGACDYVTKPFSNKILISRIRAQLRNVGEKTTEKPHILKRGSLQINPIERKVVLNENAIVLTFSEFEILFLLCSHPGQVFTRSEIISQIKGRDYPVTERSVDVQIVSIRRKLKEWGNRSIETVRGVGYRLKIDETT